MIHTLKLLLPALIPSWNFFDVIAASPRIEFALLRSEDEPPREWQPFRPRPDHVPLGAMLGRLVWNARWNETLFAVSCAERLLAEPTAHSQEEIFRRIAADLAEAPELIPAADRPAWLCFRIALVQELGGASAREIAFVSAPRRLADISPP